MSIPTDDPELTGIFDKAYIGPSYGMRSGMFCIYGHLAWDKLS